METVLAWHFVGDTLRDGRGIPADGEWLAHDGDIKICVSGLHASDRLLDALAYAPGSTLCRVECADVRDRHGDKLVCGRRRIVWRINADDLLRRFARKCALDVAHLWNAPEVVLRYLETGDELLREAATAAATSAARAATAAAWDAAWYAAWYAARDAAWDAARAATAAATSAARAATATAAAWDATGYAAWAAARIKQAAWLEAEALKLAPTK